MALKQITFRVEPEVAEEADSTVVDARECYKANTRGTHLCRT